jgi:hypothetical protein
VRAWGAGRKRRGANLRKAAGVLTAESVTDEQIRHLQASTPLTADTITVEQCAALRSTFAPRSKLWLLANIACSEVHGIARITARARCAEILNARSAKGTP